MSSSDESSDHQPGHGLKLVDKVEHAKGTELQVSAVEGFEAEQANIVAKIEAFNDYSQERFISLKQSISDVQDLYEEQLSKQKEKIMQLEAELAEKAETAEVNEVTKVQKMGMLMELKIMQNYCALLNLNKKNLNEWTTNHLQKAPILMFPYRIKDKCNKMKED